MKTMVAKGLALVSGLIAGQNALAFAQGVEWDVLSPQVVVAGNGCQKDVDAFVTANGNDLAVVFTNLGVNLPGNGASSALADRRACAVRVPARIAAGNYIGRLTQRASFGVTKTERSSGSLATRSTFFGFNVSPYTVSVGRQAMNQPLLTQKRVDDFAVSTQPQWYQGWCNPNRAPQGLYQANLVVSGQRDNKKEDLIMFVDGLDLKFEVVAKLAACL